MKKLIALLLVFCLSLTAAAALAEDEFGYYPDDYPESKVYVSTWVAEDGDWRIEVYGEDGCIKPMVVHRLGDNREDVWEYATELGEDNALVAKGLEFEKIGNFYGSRWMKGDIEVIFYDWYDGQYDIRLYQRGKDGEILNNAILKGDYDAETDTLTAEGFFDPDAPFTVTFSYDEENNVVWTENGESTVLEYSYLTD